MLKKKVLDALNEQINAELYSHYLYLSMAAYFDGENLGGFSHWMKKQSYEEYGHAMKIYKYITDRAGRVQLKAIDAPPAKWKDSVTVFEEVLDHEKKVSALIDKLVDLAQAEKDHATATFLIWFVNEQVEEEATAEAVLQKMKLLKDAPSGVFMMDRELGARE